MLCCALFLFSKHPHSDAQAAYLLFTLILWKTVFLCNLQITMYINKFHYTKVSNILTKCRVLWVTVWEQRAPGSWLQLCLKSLPIQCTTFTVRHFYLVCNSVHKVLIYWSLISEHYIHSSECVISDTAYMSQESCVCVYCMYGLCWLFNKLPWRWSVIILTVIR